MIKSIKILLSRIVNSINVLMIFDQLGGSFELAKQIGEILIHFFVGYIPRSAFYCIMMVSYLNLTPFSTGAPGVATSVIS